MNFTKTYFEAENRIKDTILSLWASGNIEFQNTLKKLIEKEPIMAEPVFQSMQPWTSAEVTFGDLSNIFDTDFMDRLDAIDQGNYRFPKQRKPYLHQLRSWEAMLLDKKSIAVTTGTGSGKTECFMLPVLHDIYRSNKNNGEAANIRPGVNAIFLYPLNALINSQMDRLRVWAEALGNITFGVYNGNTEEDGNDRGLEILNRKRMRATPPNILFTNPSMLEYILVRNSDVKFLENSQGTLRWILLDEAHTLKGTFATDIALLIRRIIDAFSVNLKDIRFAITSATVGNDDNSSNELIKFMSDLCGIDKDQITFIDGKRYLPTLEDNLGIENEIIHKKVREFIHKEDSVLLSSISKFYNKSNRSRLEQLQIIDELSQKRNELNNDSLIRLRGHYFSKAISGLYVCSNPECCDQEVPFHLGNITSTASRNCRSCNYPMFELVECECCSNHLLKGNLKHIGNEVILSLSNQIVSDPFILDSEIDDNEEDEATINENQFYFTNYNDKVLRHESLIPFSIDRNGVKNYDEVFVSIQENDKSVCPYCHEVIKQPYHFRISSSFKNRILSDVLLENSYSMEDGDKTDRTLWDGHKYISFTDSRQGTAKISALINIETENNWVKSKIFHKLWEDSPKSFTENERVILELLEHNDKVRYELYLKELTEKYHSKGLVWNDLVNFLINDDEFNEIASYYLDSDNVNVNDKRNLARAILFSNFGKKFRREQSLENLGLLSISYPCVENVDNIPQSFTDLNIDIDLGEWKNLLKIGFDYFIRSRFHIKIDNEFKNLLNRELRSYKLYSPDSERNSRWPKFTKQARINKLSFIICAGLGYTNSNEIEDEDEIKINKILSEMWNFISNHLNYSPRTESYTFTLDENVVFKIPNVLWLCPINKRLVDVNFKGISPWIKGKFNEETIDRYRIDLSKTFDFPEFPYPFHYDLNTNTYDIDRTKQWIEENSIIWKGQGVWNSYLEKLILNRPLYLSGEHSAQQSSTRLQILEDKIKKGEINILNCSTTMEMGVDIKGISTVLMNNVPPNPANYLQRAGRAGRSQESKALAYTICGQNPIGMSVMENPLWALKHVIAAPFITFSSKTVVQRHVNSLLFSYFIRNEYPRVGININDSISTFFFNEENFNFRNEFVGWLESSALEIMIVPVNSLVKGTILALEDTRNLIYNTRVSFLDFYKNLDNKKIGFEGKLESMKVEGLNDANLSYRSISIQQRNFLAKNAFSTLAEEGFLPTAGIPTGILEFDNRYRDQINNIYKHNHNNSLPSYYITRALSEFTPGKYLVINGFNYKSEGIILNNFRGTNFDKETIQCCRKCGYQRVVENYIEENNFNAPCPHCNGNSFVGLNNLPADNNNYTELIQPVGFAVDANGEKTRSISENQYSNYVDPLLLNILPWESNSSNLFEMRTSNENGEIIFYNAGYGSGFHVCLQCGRASQDSRDLINHTRLRGGNYRSQGNNLCIGNENPLTSIRRNVVLGARLKTNYCEIRISNNGIYSNDFDLLYTLGATFCKEFAHLLAIDEQELSFGVKQYNGYRSIFIYDTVKGGAGYSVQFDNFAEQIFSNSIKRLSCTCTNACTKCLIDRNTQFYISNLNREIALEWLRDVDRRKVPEEILNLNSDFKYNFYNIRQELIKITRIDDLKEIVLFVDNNFDNWNIDELFFLESFDKSVKKKFVIKNFPILDNSFEIYNLIKLINLSRIGKLYYTNNLEENQLIKIAEINTSDQKSCYYTGDNQLIESLNKDWGTNCNNVYKLVNAVECDYELIDMNAILTSLTNVFDLRITNGEFCENTLSKDLVSLVLDKINGKRLEILKDKIFKVEYNDRYITSPFACVLVSHFLKGFKNYVQCEYNTISIRNLELESNGNILPEKFFYNFQQSSTRDTFLKDLLKHIVPKGNIDVQSFEMTDTEHARTLKIYNDTIEMNIVVDGGLAHGIGCNQFKEWYLYPTDEILDLDLIIKKRFKEDLKYFVTIKEI